MTNVPTLDLEQYRQRLRQEMLNGIKSFEGDGPITRVDVWYDLVSMDDPMVRLYLTITPRPNLPAAHRMKSI